MNKVILLALIPLFTACTSVQKNTTNRVPNVWNDLTQAPVTLFSDNASQKLGESQPWKLTESDYYCINNKPDSTLSQDKFPIQGDGKIQKQWHQYFFDINSYFFRTFTCQSDYQILLKNILKSVRGPFYTPYPSQDQPNQYLVSDYKSFHQLDYHYALIDNLVSQNTTTVTAHKNNYQNSEEYTSNDLISQSFSTDYYNCRVTISAGGKYFDVFTHLCLTGSKSTYIFSDDDKKYVFYINFNNKNGTPNFQLKKHQIKLRSEAEISKRTEDNSPSEEADEVILNYHLNKTVTYNPSEIAIPINFSMVPLENGNFIIVTQIQDYNRSHFQITTLDKNFRVLSHDGIYSPKQNEFLELSNATSAGFTYSSSYNLLGQMTYYSYDFNLKTSEKIKESKRYSHKKRDEDIRSEFLLYTADDGRKFPMTVYYKSDYKKFQKTNFGLISSYGGFNQIDDLGQIEIFDRNILDHGGFVANVTIRGGGEMGPLVWKEAFGKNRINSFNDLNSATQELIRKGFAFHKKIALTGTSNGGLLVLSAAGLRPDLYGAVISLSPVVDVLNLPTLDARYASTWLELDYGDIKDPEVEKFWKVHQPISLLPQVKNLPPILLRSAHGDEIVSPLHVFNLYEQLMKRKDRSQFFMYHQPKSFDHNPKNIKQGIEESSYIQTFLFKALGVKIKEMKD